MSLASREIWNWRAAITANQERPQRETARLRRRGLLQGLVIVAVGTALNRGFGHELAGRLLVVIGALQTLLAVVRPLWLGAVERRLRRFGELVARVLAWLLLGPLWLLVFVPAGLVLRWQGRDPLHRGPLPPGVTAWIPRRRAPAAESCARQFLDEDREARALRRPVGTLPEPSLLAALDADHHGGDPA